MHPASDRCHTEVNETVRSGRNENRRNMMQSDFDGSQWKPFLTSHGSRYNKALCNCQMIEIELTHKWYTLQFIS